MLAPLIGVGGKVHYVNPSLIRYMTPGDPLVGEELAPDGNPWPTTFVHFGEGDAIHAKGTAPMILQSWFGPPENRQSNIVVPTLVAKRPAGRM